MSWEIAEGEELARREVHESCGGQQQGGISTPRGSSDILLFMSRKGRTYGYNFDGPQEDGTYQYTGEGRIGDQKFTPGRGNAAVRDHRASGRTLRLFKETRRSVVRYVGEYVLDERRPYRFADAPDRKKDLRLVIVFHLRRAEDMPQFDDVRRNVEVVIEDTDLEAHKTDRFRVNRAQPETEAERREAKLVQRYADWLKRQGHEAKQRLIKLPDHVAALRTDLFDITANELVEAKGSSSRSDVRMALGQVLDYSEHAGAGRRAVLLPTSPAQDMLDLLVKYGVSCIFEEGEGQFKRVDAAAMFCGACPLTNENSTSN
jgi:hypothetical protein